MNICFKRYIYILFLFQKCQRVLYGCSGENDKFPLEDPTLQALAFLCSDSRDKISSDQGIWITFFFSNSMFILMQWCSVKPDMYKYKSLCYK